MMRTKSNKSKSILSIGFYRYFNNTAWLFSEQLLRMVSGLFIGIWIARYLGPDNYGVYSYIIGVAAILGGIAKMGMDAVIVQELINNPEQRNQYLGSAFWVRVAGAILLSVVYGTILFISEGDRQIDAMIALIMIGIIFQSFDILEAHFLSEVQAKVVSICKMIQVLISSALKLYCIYNESSLIYFVAIFAFDFIIISGALFYAYTRQNSPRFLSAYCHTTAKRLLKKSWPLLLSTLVVLVYQKIDLIIVNHMLGNYSTGIYTAALKFTDSFYFVPLLITNSLATALINSRKTDVNKYRDRLKKLYHLVLGLTTIIAVIIYFSSEFLIKTFYGQEYIKAASLQSIHSVTIVLVGVGILITRWHIIENRPKIAFYNTLAGSVVSLVANFTLIPILGLIGAIIASIIANFVAAFAMNIVWKETRNEFISFNKPNWKKYDSLPTL